MVVFELFTICYSCCTERFCRHFTDRVKLVFPAFWDRNSECKINFESMFWWYSFGINWLTINLRHSISRPAVDCRPFYCSVIYSSQGAIWSPRKPLLTNQGSLIEHFPWKCIHFHEKCWIYRWLWVQNYRFFEWSLPCACIWSENYSEMRLFIRSGMITDESCA